jgi:hypothetical protein
MDRREFFLAPWGKHQLDLFVLDRNTNRRWPLQPPSSQPWVLRIYSGATTFAQSIAKIPLRSKLSKRLSKGNWWISLGKQRAPKPNLIMVTKAHQTGSERTEIHVLSGGQDYQHFSTHLATEWPARQSLLHPFVFTRGPHGGTVLMVLIDRGRFRVQAVPLP